MKRKNNRKANETRPIKIEVGVIPNADGSALFGFGKTTAIAAVYGPSSMHPKHKQKSNRAVLQTYYTMLPFSTTERVRPGPSRRSTELCKVIREALEPVVFLEEFPKAGISIYIHIIQADAGTRTAAINAASLALADAGIPMRDLVASVAGGKIDKEYVIDLEGKEEDDSVCDIPLAYIPRTKEISLLQMDGDLSPNDVSEIMKLCVANCEIIYQKQKEALEKKWVKGE
ncbi:MAG: exosome complex exonuclease Rrp41 [Candidatus Aenigmatarchaeota archaeon]|nr:exosome complex exonuclease Rrp41 [Nanoarchaeota archaeon]